MAAADAGESVDAGGGGSQGQGSERANQLFSAPAQGSHDERLRHRASHREEEKDAEAARERKLPLLGHRLSE